MSATDRAPSARADVCIVGSGPAGALTAHSLARAGHDVVVLEAGPRFDFSDRIERMERRLRPSHTPLDVWDMGGPMDEYTGDRSYRLNTSRVKAVGGTSLHWGGTCPRMHVSDFEEHSRYGTGEDWPISYDDLRPYYAQAEREIGIASAADNPFGPPRDAPFPMPAFPPSYTDQLFAPACESVGIATHSVPRAQNSVPRDGRSQCQGYGTCTPVCPSGAKYSATAHVEDAEAEGARVVDQVPVQRLVHDGDTVTAAEYVTPEGETYRQEARRFVVACGAVETARLLLLSESEAHPDGLANASGAVGKYFMSHPEVSIRAELDEHTQQNQVGFPTTMSHQFYEPGDGPGRIQLEFSNTAEDPISTLAMGSREVLDRFEGVVDAPADPGSWADLVQAPVDGAAWGDEMLDELRESYGNHVRINGICGQEPRAENRVTLDYSTTDPHGNPVPHVEISAGAYADSARDFAFERQAEIVRAMGASPPFDRYEGMAPHQMGTTRMGDDPATSVVNPYLRAHDVTNLHVVSGSVFVTSGAVNPTITIAALALRAADHLDEDL